MLWILTCADFADLEPIIAALEAVWVRPLTPIAEER